MQQEGHQHIERESVSQTETERQRYRYKNNRDSDRDIEGFTASTSARDETQVDIYTALRRESRKQPSRRLDKNKENHSG